MFASPITEPGIKEHARLTPDCPCARARGRLRFVRAIPLFAQRSVSCSEIFPFSRQSLCQRQRHRPPAVKTGQLHHRISTLLTLAFEGSALNEIPHSGYRRSKFVIAWDCWVNTRFYLQFSARTLRSRLHISNIHSPSRFRPLRYRVTARIDRAREREREGRLQMEILNTNLSQSREMHDNRISRIIRVGERASPPHLPSATARTDNGQIPFALFSPFFFLPVSRNAVLRVICSSLLPPTPAIPSAKELFGAILLRIKIRCFRFWATLNNLPCIFHRTRRRISKRTVAYDRICARV